jgi:hypothetical protein
MVPQGVLPFQYLEETSCSGMTALAGLPAYLDLAYVAGLSQSIQRHVKLREGKQGWSDAQMVTSLVLFNLAAGDAVEDLETLEKDAGGVAKGRGSWPCRVGSDRLWNGAGVISGNGRRPRHRRCFAIWRGSMTCRRSSNAGPTRRSSLHPTQPWPVWERSTRTW